MRAARIALGAELVLLLVGVALVLQRSPMSVAATNKPANQEPEAIASTRNGASICQGDETLPRGTSAIRVSLGASIGPHLRLVVSSGGRTVTSGEQDSGWTGAVVAIPVRPLAHPVANTQVCVSFRPANETLVLYGKPTRGSGGAQEDGRGLGGTIWIEYLRPGTRTWASLASSIVRNMGFARAWGGEAIPFLAIASLLAALALASSLLYRELR